MRLLCKIFGCEMDDTPGARGCRRCGTWIYDWPFVHREMAWLNPWYSFVWWLRCNWDWFYRRCEVCKKPMTFTKNYCCSQDCYDNWIPF